MSVKRSQQFLYFQNKARHYDHLKKIKTTIDNRRSKSSLNNTTIDGSLLLKYATNCKRKTPIMKRYELQQQNLGIINRIVGIMHSPRVELEKQGYSRNNNGNNFRFTRSVFQKQEQKKDLANENLKLATKLIKTKPSIGTIHEWNCRYEEVRKHKRQISQYQDTNSRGSFDIYTDRNFIPTHYKNFLNRKSSVNPSQTVRKSINFQVSRDMLFELPRLKKVVEPVTKFSGFNLNESVTKLNTID